jgi:iron complex outermembrane receptor protein
MRTISFALCAAVLALPYSLSAQQPQQQDQVLEEVFVTGSLIRRSSFGGPSPVQQITAADIELQGATNVIDVVKNLAINSG